ATYIPFFGSGWPCECRTGVIRISFGTVYDVGRRETDPKGWKRLDWKVVPQSFFAWQVGNAEHANQWDLQGTPYNSAQKARCTIVLSRLKLTTVMAAPLNFVYRWAVPAAAIFALGQAAIYDVKGGTRAVIFDRLSGVQEKVINEGTHFLIPW